MGDERPLPPEPVDLATAPGYLWGAGCEGWHLLATPELSVIRERMPAGTAEVRHFHRRAQQFFYLLAGRLTIEIEGQEHELAPGQGLHVPAAVPHQVFNRAESPAEFLVISQPPSHGDRIAAPGTG
ncbi:MAG: cupin domain-containing protein [Thermoanaerobaculia bacterium]|nr:cupin domain-containing protein [Thermoanaerobaculia bacterium]